MHKFLIVVTLLLLTPFLAHAELDGDESTVDQDRQHFRARSTIRKMTKYRVHDLENERHTVQEFVDSSGHVFAVRWHGQFPPQFEKLLGRHYTDYLATARALPQRKGQRNLSTVTTGKIKFVQVGHMGHFTGVAYLIDRLPPGLSIDQLE